LFDRVIHVSGESACDDHALEGIAWDMQVTETLSEGLKRAYTVVLPASDIETRRSERLVSLGKTLRLPGFRPGKVPIPVVRQRYGSAVAAEVVEESVNEAARQMLTERNLRPAMQPKIDVVSEPPGAADPAKDIEFKVELELLPEIAMPDFGAISLTRLKAEVVPEAIETTLGNIAKANRALTPISEQELAERTESPGAAVGEVLTVDFVGKMDGTEFPGGKGEDTEVELGGTGFIPGFAEQLVGMRPGETRTIEVTFPADYGAANLAGKQANFDVTAKQLSKANVPAIDDALADQLGFGSLEALREVVSGRMKQEYDSLSRLRIKRQLLDALSNVANFASPQGMVDQEFEQIWRRVEADREAGRLDEDDKGKDEETLKSEYRAIADRRVRLGLLLAEIGRTNNISVSQEEMARAMRAEAARYPGQEARMMEFLQKYPSVSDGLRGPIFEDKVVDFVLELAQVNEQTVTPEALSAEPPAQTATA